MERGREFALARWDVEQEPVQEFAGEVRSFDVSTKLIVPIGTLWIDRGGEPTLPSQLKSSGRSPVSTKLLLVTSKIVLRGGAHRNVTEAFPFFWSGASNSPVPAAQQAAEASHR
ncbi:MAG: hypothetical protein GKS06_20560 [Acidobacteria bacterium]|nr:hypothetical protein [Acidobacteriota bacterium]